MEHLYIYLIEMLKQYEQAYIKCMGAIEFLEKKKAEESKDKKEDK